MPACQGIVFDAHAFVEVDALVGEHHYVMRHSVALDGHTRINSISRRLHSRSPSWARYPGLAGAVAACLTRE
jgi:hypothetical protein